jgi:hypothetical protein
MIELKGKVSEFIRKNYAFAGHPTKPGAPEAINLTGNLEIDRGNFNLAYFTLNGFILTISGGNCRRLSVRNLPIDSYAVLDPAALPGNVIVQNGAYWDKDFTYQEKNINPEVKKIYETLSPLGPEGKSSFILICQKIKAGTADMTLSDMKAAFEAEAGDLPFEPERLAEKLRNTLGKTWIELRSFIQNTPESELNGEEAVTAEYS